MLFAIFSGLTTEKPAAAAAAAAAAKKNLTTWTCFSYPMKKSQWVSGKKFKLFSSYKQKTIGGAKSAPPPVGIRVKSWVISQTGSVDGNISC